VEVIDIRSVRPLDRTTILGSVARTRRLVVVDPASRMCGIAAEVAATVAESLFHRLKAPVVRLTAPDVPVPFSPHLERLMYPTTADIVSAVRRLCARPSSQIVEVRKAMDASI
jgi:pyruvate/2-oxoglutarate/acetoin dehydrogenase E1 component